MMQDVSALRNYIGTPYSRKDKDGMAMGCLLPIYLLYPNAPKFKWPRSNSFEKMIATIKTACAEIEESKIMPGDIVVIRMPRGVRHLGVYLGAGECIHCGMIAGIETIKLYAMNREIEGVYRWTP